MSGLVRGIIALVALILAAACQQSLAPRISVFGASPDFLLATAIPLALVSSPRVGIWIGFAAGLLQGGIAGANMAHYVLSRSLTGFVATFVRLYGFEIRVVTAAIGAAIGTIFAQLLLMFFAPPPELIPFLVGALKSATYNGLLAMPVFALVQRVLGRERT